MAFFDKLKDAYETNKQIREEKRAAAEAYDNEMKGKVEELRQIIIGGIEANYREDLDGFYSLHDKDSVFKYTKEFYEKILLPASSMKKSYLSMYPYIDESKAGKLSKSFGSVINASDIVVYIKDKEKQEFLLTYDTFYFRTALPEDKRYFVVGNVPCSKISLFSLKKNDVDYSFMCDDIEVAKLSILDGREDDFITLDKFFLDIKNEDFNITDEEVDATIKKKIGFEISEEIKRYYLTEDEKMLFFAWGGDGSDYTVCTNEQIIVVDKEAFGKTANVKQFDYDDISNVEVLQNSGDSSLTGMLLDAAWSSVFKDCTLAISGSGKYIKITGMQKIEADRIVAIYNEFKREIKKEEKMLKQSAAQPQVIVQQSNEPDVFTQLEKLAALKEKGIISEEEFSTKKDELLSKL